MKKFGSSILAIWLIATTVMSAVFGVLYFKSKNNKETENDIDVMAVSEIVVNKLQNDIERFKTETTAPETVTVNQAVAVAESTTSNIGLDYSVYKGTNEEEQSLFAPAGPFGVVQNMLMAFNGYFEAIANGTTKAGDIYKDTELDSTYSYTVQYNDGYLSFYCESIIPTTETQNGYRNHICLKLKLVDTLRDYSDVELFWGGSYWDDKSVSDSTSPVYFTFSKTAQNQLNEFLYVFRSISYQQRETKIIHDEYTKNKYFYTDYTETTLSEETVANELVTKHAPSGATNEQKAELKAQFKSLYQLANNKANAVANMRQTIIDMHLNTK